MNGLYSQREGKTIWFSEAGTRYICDVMSEHLGRAVTAAEAEGIFGRYADYDADFRKRILQARDEASLIPVGPEELERMVDMARTEGVVLHKVDQKWAAPGAWLMGKPSLPDHIPWPVVTHRDGGKVPLTFVAQINLGQLPPTAILPKSGMLFFFVDMTSPLNDELVAARVLCSEQVFDDERPLRSDGPASKAKAIPVAATKAQCCNCTVFDSKDFREAALAANEVHLAEARRAELVPALPQKRWFQLRPPRGPALDDQLRHCMLLGPDIGGWEDFEDVSRVPLLTLDASDPDLGLTDLEWPSRPVTFTIRENDLRARNFDAVQAVLRG
ncbi:DUF1963 domain-containing protein [Tropicibacter sp. R15_0]|uniref:DUF1963 domain-containing protein n=1 Tax=Tropicibacter sp. R15_0 TaxID=2821101 RepID=UPI001ADBB157|nr:DUF1963 domain-containing protein [Tropicibacter sp. R15_0]